MGRLKCWTEKIDISLMSKKMKLQSAASDLSIMAGNNCLASNLCAKLS